MEETAQNYFLPSELWEKVLIHYRIGQGVETLIPTGLEELTWTPYQFFKDLNLQAPAIKNLGVSDPQNRKGWLKLAVKDNNIQAVIGLCLLSRGASKDQTASDSQILDDLLEGAGDRSAPSQSAESYRSSLLALLEADPTLTKAESWKNALQREAERGNLSMILWIESILSSDGLSSEEFSKAYGKCLSYICKNFRDLQYSEPLDFRIFGNLAHIHGEVTGQKK